MFLPLHHLDKLQFPAYHTPRVSRESIFLHPSPESSNAYIKAKANIEEHFVKEIKNNSWGTVNNDFLSRVRRFDNDVHE